MANFRTRARALDLLGRQQIAGIPTAINELIKNAHDAYADNFDIDFLRTDDLLVLRDDGLGMTKFEFENRWLTIGTESKLKRGKTELPPIDNTKPLRPIMGEKGIGRLAIASIGKQVLVLTRAVNRGSGKIIAALINWEIFELPNINLEDIIVPVVEFENIPTAKDIDVMKEEIMASIKQLFSDDLIAKSDYESICSSIESFNVDPSNLSKTLPGATCLMSKSGTHFYISPVSESLISDIEGYQSIESDKDASKIEKMLMGFHNTMIPKHAQPTVNIVFRDYRNGNDSFVDIIDNEHFFTPEDFEIADHHFIGQFDKYGQFRGKIRIYGEKTYDHIVTWNENKFRETNCGPFAINLAYLQGDLKSSTVKAEDYYRIKAKGDKFGGLYIYRNNIRILPYGDSDYDFIDIEKNRTKRISTYFFSYRRMFGAIELSSDTSSELIEKAGREGFIENKAYRQLQAILKNFFTQLAADFFNVNKPTAKTEFYASKKDELNSMYKALERREQLAKNKKDVFTTALDTFFTQLSNNTFKRDIEFILSGFKNELASIVHIVDPDDTSMRLINAEYSVRKRISDYKAKVSIPSPKGFAMTKSLRIDYETYLNESRHINDSIFSRAYSEVDCLVDEFRAKLNLELSKRKRLENAVNRISEEALSLNKKKKNETNEIATSITRRIKELTNELIIELDNQIKEVKTQFTSLNIENADNFDLVKERARMEQEIDEVSTRNTQIMERIIRQFESFYIERDEAGEIITSDQISDAMAEELDDLRNKLQTDIELSQLGLAVGILHHEFSSTVGSIRRGLKDLKAWSDVDEKLESTYRNLKINFEHLDGYLNLFTPLNRRLNRRRENIPLMDIKLFLIDLFKSRLERHGIQFKHTIGFSKSYVYGFRSTFYPVFVNIIDNAIYWLKQSDKNDKVIRLHADEHAIYISNNGPEISLTDKERIFQLRFSRKQNGRGLGLSISRDVLESEGYNIVVDAPRENSTVTFKISKSSNNG